MISFFAAIVASLILLLPFLAIFWGVLKMTAKDSEAKRFMSYNVTPKMYDYSKYGKITFFEATTEIEKIYDHDKNTKSSKESVFQDPHEKGYRLDTLGSSLERTARIPYPENFDAYKRHVLSTLKEQAEQSSQIPF